MGTGSEGFAVWRGAHQSAGFILSAVYVSDMVCLHFVCCIGVGAVYFSLLLFPYEAVERRTVEVGQRFACGERQGGRVQPTKKCFPGKHES